jgi:hypothetical protein
VYVANHTTEKKKYEQPLRWVIDRIKEKNCKTLKQKINYIVDSKSKLSLIRLATHKTTMDNIKYTKHN